jgi:hypothetical protein
MASSRDDDSKLLELETQLSKFSSDGAGVNFINTCEEYCKLINSGSFTQINNRNVIKFCERAFDFLDDPDIQAIMNVDTLSTMFTDNIHAAQKRLAQNPTHDATETLAFKKEEHTPSPDSSHKNLLMDELKNRTPPAATAPIRTAASAPRVQVSATSTTAILTGQLAAAPVAATAPIPPKANDRIDPSKIDREPFRKTTTGSPTRKSDEPVKKEDIEKEIKELAKGIKLSINDFDHYKFSEAIVKVLDHAKTYSDGKSSGRTWIEKFSFRSKDTDESKNLERQYISQYLSALKSKLDSISDEKEKLLVFCNPKEIEKIKKDIGDAILEEKFGKKPTPAQQESIGRLVENAHQSGKLLDRVMTIATALTTKYPNELKQSDVRRFNNT